LDILLIGGDSTPYLLQNRGGTRFEEVMRLSGEPGYIFQAGATSAELADFNNDTFVDIFAGYEEEPCQFFFNRGFRSFAINEPLKLKAEDLEGADKGQAAAIWADLGGTGALELVTALANGDVYLSRTNLGAAERPLFVRVPFPAEARSAGPLVVRFYLEGRCLGARVADRWSGPALLGVPEAGTYAIKYKLPDGKEVAREAEAGEELKPPGKPTVGTQGAKPTGASPAPVRRPTPAPGTEASGLSGGALALIAGLVALVTVIIIVVMVKSRKEKGP